MRCVMTGSHMTMPEEFLNVTELAARLGVRERVIATLVRQRKIPFAKVGKAIRFSWPAIQAWFQELSRSDGRSSRPATLPVTHPVAKGIPTVSDDGEAGALRLVRGRKGQHRAEVE